MADVTMGQATGLARLSVEHGGRTYTCGLYTLGVQAAFEDWLIDQAYASLERRRPRMSQAAYEAALSRTEDKLGLGHYAEMGEINLRAKQTVAGLTALAAILFGLPVDEMSRLIVAAPQKFKAAIQAAIASSDALPRPAEGNGPAESASA